MKRPCKFSDEMRRAIEASGLTRYRIFQETGVDQAVLHRFVNGGGISLESLDKLAACLGWRLDASSAKRKAGGE